MDIGKQTVILTGATGGIGEEIAKVLTKQGAKLLLVGRNEDKLKRLVEQLLVDTLLADTLPTCDSLACLRQKPQYYVADISQRSEREKLIAWGNELGATMLINNAGINQFGAFSGNDKVGEESAQQKQNIEVLMQINIIAPMALCQQFLANKVQRKNRTIVNVGSAFGSIGFPYYANYCASKFALRGFSQALHRELAGSGDEVFYFAPRATATSMNSEAVNQMNAELGNNVDSPKVVAKMLIKQLQQDNIRYLVGGAERFFAKLNALFPRLVDSALIKKARVIKRFVHQG
jgi:short-subunit dehydrogenase